MIQISKLNNKNSFRIIKYSIDEESKKSMIEGYFVLTLYDFDLFLIDARYDTKATFLELEELTYKIAKQIQASNIYLNFSFKDAPFEISNEIKAHITFTKLYKFEKSEYNAEEQCTVMSYVREVELDPLFKDAIIIQSILGLDYKEKCPEGYRLLSSKDMEYLKKGTITYILNDKKAIVKFKNEEITFESAGTIYPSDNKKVMFDYTYILWTDPDESKKATSLFPTFEINRYSQTIAKKELFSRCTGIGIYIKN